MAVLLMLMMSILWKHFLRLLGLLVEFQLMLMKGNSKKRFFFNQPFDGWQLFDFCYQITILIDVIFDNIEKWIKKIHNSSIVLLGSNVKWVWQIIINFHKIMWNYIWQLPCNCFLHAHFLRTVFYSIEKCHEEIGELLLRQKEIDVNIRTIPNQKCS